MGAAEVGGGLAFITAPPAPFVPPEVQGHPVVAMIVTYCGDPDEGAQVVAPLREFGPPAVDLIEPMPYVAVQQLIESANPHGMQNYWTADFYDTLPDEYHSLLLTTVEKNTQDFVVQAIGDLVESDEVTDEPLVGTLENEGVGLADYHDLADRVTPELQAQLDDLRERIVAGEITVESPSAP